MRVLAFIPSLINEDWHVVYLKLIIVGICWGWVTMAILIDLYFGIKKSKEYGEFITSEGYRRTIKKSTYYFSILLFALIFDSILSILVYYAPFPANCTPPVTMLATLGLVLTEFKSVREKADDKHRRRTDSSFTDLAKILKDKDFLSRVYEEISKRNDEEEKKEK